MVLRDGWLLTGDLAKMDADGYFYIVDRKKDMILCSGFNVYPREVEEVLFMHPAVGEAAALREHRHLRGARVLCQREGSPLTQKIVQDHVRRATRRAQLTKSGVHRLRHTFCSHLAMRGAPARAIQELAGHQDLGTTQRYMHLSPAAIEGAIRLLDSTGILPSRGNIVATGSTEIGNSSR